MFAENGLEKLGSTIFEISKINHQMYYIWLNLINKKQRSVSSPNLKVKKEYRNWKNYAHELEKNLKEINEFRINSHLKQDLGKKLEIYNLESRQNNL